MNNKNNFKILYKIYYCSIKQVSRKNSAWKKVVDKYGNDKRAQHIVLYSTKIEI